MLSKIKQNFNEIVLFSTIVSLVFFGYYFFGFINKNLTEAVIIDIVKYALALSAELVLLFAVINKKLDDKAVFSIAFSLIVASGAVNVVYAVISNSYNAIVLVALYVSALVLYLIYLKDRKVKKALLMVLGILVIYSFVNTLPGSYLSCAYLLTYLICVLKIYFEKGDIE